MRVRNDSPRVVFLHSNIEKIPYHTIPYQPHVEDHNKQVELTFIGKALYDLLDEMLKVCDEDKKHRSYAGIVLQAGMYSSVV